MAETLVLLDPCMDDAHVAETLELITGFGAYPMYVEDLIDHGIGKGMVKRHDAMMHYVRGKYAAGEVESMQDLAARTNLFRGTFAQGETVYVEAAESLLYTHAPFVEAAKALTDCEVVVPDMLYANFLLPGQELPLHTDTPEYRGMSKVNHPEWLLVVMQHSGLFEDWRVRIAGGVTFFNPPNEGGAFVVHVDGKERRLGVTHNASVLLDADALFHGVERVGASDAPAPAIKPGMHLVHTDGGRWEVRDGDDVVSSHAWGEVRLSIQWKALCFKDDSARQLFHDHTDDLDYDRVLAVLIADLRSRGVLGEQPPDDTALSLLMIDTYVNFPEA